MSFEHGTPTPIRVLFLSQAPGVGGGERAALEGLARAEDLATTVVGPEPVVRFGYQLGLPGLVAEAPRVHRLQHLPRAGLGGLRFRAIAKRLRSEVLYANGTRAFPYGIMARVLGGPPLIAHHHGILTTGPTRTLIRGLERLASEIVVPSRESAKPFGGGKIRVVPNGVDVNHFRPADSSRGHSPTVGTVARVAPGKGLEAFMRTAELIARDERETTFLLAGGPAFPDDNPYWHGVTRTAGRLGHRLTMTGHLEDPLSAYLSMDVFLHLSEPESFPLTVLEAMSCGLPTVAYRWGGVPEIIEDGTDGFLIDPGDEVAVAACVRSLLEDKERRLQIGARARAKCEEHFTLERVAADLSAVIHRAAN